MIQTVEYDDHYTELAIHGCSQILGTYVNDGVLTESFRNSRNIEGSITEGDGCLTAEFIIDHFTCVELADVSTDRICDTVADGDVRVFDNLQDAVDSAYRTYMSARDLYTGNRYLSVRVITEDVYADEVARFDGDLPSLVAEIYGSEGAQ